MFSVPYIFMLYFISKNCSASLLSISNMAKTPDSVLSILQRIQQETIFET